MKIFDMQQNFDFENFFILDMANNHKGSFDYGRRIVNEFSEVVRETGVRAGIKFQFRHLESLVHPDHQESSEYEYISYFQKNRLSEDEYRVLVSDIRNMGMIPIATPFDEASVDMLDRLGIDILKIASSSATDWPLLERVVESNKPMIVSTAGLTLVQTDNLYSFLTHRGVNFALMHCVGIYPTPNNKLNLKRISILKNRYPGAIIGFSTHEDPDDTSAVKVAYAEGARIFERHIGIKTEDKGLNEYSSQPHQVRKWLEAWHDVREMLGDKEKIERVRFEEEKDLSQFQRGVYLRRSVGQGEKLRRKDVFFAMPLQPGQMKVGEFKNPIITDKSYSAGEPLPIELVPQEMTKTEIIHRAIHEVNGMLHEAKVPTNYDSNVELSHHYGIENFFEVGALLIDCINREYCKKIIIMLPGQRHPSHYHKKKEETFQILSGELIADIEDREKRLLPGDTLVVPRGVWHGFRAPEGVIFEEISTTHYNDDSFYEDKRINNMERDERKTKLINWGRHQFEDNEDEQLPSSSSRMVGQGDDVEIQPL